MIYGVNYPPLVAGYYRQAPGDWGIAMRDKGGVTPSWLCAWFSQFRTVCADRFVPSIATPGKSAMPSKQDPWSVLGLNRASSTPFESSAGIVGFAIDATGGRHERYGSPQIMRAVGARAVSP